MVLRIENIQIIVLQLQFDRAHFRTIIERKSNGFFPGENVSLDNPLTVLAAFEAAIGLIIEISFIATFTKRFFGS